MRHIYLYFLLITLAGCEFTAEDKAKVYYYFPLEEYMREEIKNLKSQGMTIKKMAMINEEKETVQYHVVKDSLRFPLEQELGPFLNADINKPAYRDQYTTKYDTMNDGTVIQTHKALKEDLVTRSIKIWQQNETVQKIEVQTFTDNAVYKTTQHLTFMPGSGYSIDADQKVLVTGEEEYLIKAEFINE